MFNKLTYSKPKGWLVGHSNYTEQYTRLVLRLLRAEMRGANHHTRFGLVSKINN